ncbi:glycosyltransferase family 39 protein [Rhizobium lemnae]|uniref:ArnT family glycosyltransferase n=1 Tax=Rhizobium lemnae TaxID=1214924 RepID=A0ABV8EF45_9HYPH|nr:glycosyltransferase family 39 protein [Rhizobium lemnae]MCJ8509412.1 glycosyltransferase family 39 protein [Rhizobium lemnae]
MSIGPSVETIEEAGDADVFPMPPGSSLARAEKVPVERRRHVLNLIIIGLVSLFLFAPGINLMPLTDRDEALYVQASRQMLETGDWVDIRFQQEPRYKKPVGIYWLQGLSAKVFGEGAASPLWIYRLPSLFGALLTAFFTYAIAARIGGSKAGLIAGLLAASTVELAFEARIGKTDAMLCAMIVASQFGLACAYLDPQRRQVLWRNGLFWIALGLGTLIKGPVAPMIAGLTIIGLTATERNLSLIRALSPVRGVLVYLLVVLPWLAAIGWISKGAFFAQSVGHDMLGKVATGQEGHGAPPGTYLLIGLGTFWPLSIFASLAILWGWTQRKSPEVRFLFFWAVPAWLIFELIATKLPNYILPMMPALAVLTGLALADKGLRTESRWFRFTYFGIAALGILLAIALNAVFYVSEHRLSWLGMALGCVLALVAVAAWRLLVANKMREGIAVSILAAGMAYVLAFAIILPGAERLWLTDRIANAATKMITCPAPIILTVGYEEPSLVFRLGTGMQRLAADDAATAFYRSSCAFAAVTVGESENFQKSLLALGEVTTPVQIVEGRNLNGFNLRQMQVFLKR